MKILFIAPLPPPITGHSLAAKVFVDDLSKTHEVEIVNLSKDSAKSRRSAERVFQVAKILKDIWERRKDQDVIYLTISESFAGNVKDLLIYLICLKNLSKTYIHLHGGSLKKLLFDRHKILFSLNKIFIGKLAGVIISGQSHLIMFDNLIQRKKIHIVPNFATDCLFASEEQVIDKFSNTEPLRILYISSLQPRKGYNDLADAYLGLSGNLKEKIRVDFAGRFDSESDKKMFLEKIHRGGQIYYHGLVDNAQKQFLFSRAHVFCLPSNFLEGQPLSILEAYASGCVVLTTCKPGILDVFEVGVNGFEMQGGSSDSIKLALEKILRNREDLHRIAMTNRKKAGEKYRTSSYNAKLRAIIETPIAAFPIEC